jgi:hypothetical protein
VREKNGEGKGSGREEGRSQVKAEAAQRGFPRERLELIVPRSNLIDPPYAIPDSIRTLLSLED